MNTAAHIVKLIFAWGCFVGAIVCFIVAPAMVVPLAVTSIAASQLPESQMTEEVKELTIDEKLDKIMEAVTFQHKLLVSALVSMDKLLGEKKKSIIQL